MLEWTEAVATGIDSIDSHNREFYNKLNSFLIANTNAEGRHHVEELLVFLEDYLKEHRNVQERFMEIHGYPHAEDHKEDHIGFQNMISEWNRKLQKNGVTSVMVLELQSHMGEWFVNHITLKDKRLAAHMSGYSQVRTNH